MKLYVVACGFYDLDLCDGIYEGHVNLFIAARDFEEAKIKVRSDEIFKKKKMHVDGLQEVELVNGYRIRLSQDAEQGNRTNLIGNRHRDL